MLHLYIAFDQFACRHCNAFTFW